MATVSPLIYGGLTQAQYASLLTPLQNSCIESIKLLMRRLWHLVIHREWISDARLIDRLFQHIKLPTNKIDETVREIFREFCQRAYTDNTKQSLADIQKILEPQVVSPKPLETPFSVDFRFLGFYQHEGTELPKMSLYDEIEELLKSKKDGLQRHDFDPLYNRIKALKEEIEKIYEKNLHNFESSTLRDKECYLAQLRQSLDGMRALYQEKLACIQTENFEGEHLIPFLQTILKTPLEPIRLLRKTIHQIHEVNGIEPPLRELINKILNGIMRDDPNWQKLNPEVKDTPPTDPYKLMVDVRQCRKWIVNHDRFKIYPQFNEVSFGDSASAYNILSYIVNSRTCGNLTHKHGAEEFTGVDRLTFTQPGEDILTWVPMGIDRRHFHSVPLVYTYVEGTPHFVRIDNMSYDKRKVSVDEVLDMSQKNETLDWFSLKVTIANENAPKPALSPRPETWMIPKWENNNCFFLSALIGLAVSKFYEAQNPQLTEQKLRALKVPIPGWIKLGNQWHKSLVDGDHE